MRNKRLAEAKKHLDLADEQARQCAGLDFAKAYYLRTKALKERDLKLLGKAKRHLQRALQLEPKHRNATVALDQHTSFINKLSGR